MAESMASVAMPRARARALDMAMWLTFIVHVSCIVRDDLCSISSKDVVTEKSSWACYLQLKMSQSNYVLHSPSDIWPIPLQI